MLYLTTLSLDALYALDLDALTALGINPPTETSAFPCETAVTMATTCIADTLLIVATATPGVEAEVTTATFINSWM